MKRAHGYMALIRDRDGGFKFWRGFCSCGWTTQVEHLSRAAASGALMEHIVTSRVERLVSS